MTTPSNHIFTLKTNNFLPRVLVTIVTAGGEGPPSPPLVFRTRPIPPSAPQPPTLKNKAGCYSLHLKWGKTLSGYKPITEHYKSPSKLVQV